MPEATGTLAQQFELVSDTPTDINAIKLRVTVIAAAISTIANELTVKLKQTPGPVDRKFEQEAMAQIEPLNRELERLLAIKRQIEGQKR